MTQPPKRPRTPGDDKTIADELVQGELFAQIRALDATEIHTFGSAAIGVGHLPPAGGAGTLIPVHIGMRGHLSERCAREAAETWCEATRCYPKALFMIVVLGYAEDPREIWEVPEAARYVRWWAKFAGMDDYDAADHWVGPSSIIGRSGRAHATAGLGFLAGCGVFGDEIKRQTLAGSPPTSAH